ncbi:hypothetical protein BsWGS_13053 [Bradybaena similaris]
MESVHHQLHSSTQAVESPVLIGSPLPATNFIQLSSSALVPLGSSSAFGSILSVPVISHPLVSPVQQKQQQPMQNEPLLLLPTSALSLPAQTNFVVSTPFFNSKIQSASVDPSQQFHLNSTQMPFILKPPDSNSSLHIEQALNAQQINQQFVVLPVNAGNRDLSQVSNRDNQNRPTVQQKDILENTKNLKDRKSKLHGKLTAAQLHSNKSEPSKSEMKTRSVKNKDISVTKSDSVVESPAVKNANYERSKLDLAQIISSIPPGWQVVGVTGSNQMALGDSVSSFNCSSSIASALAVKPTTSAAEVSCEIKCGAGLLTSKFPSHDQPGLVSVNLNTSSQPVASETVIDKWPAKELTCSVKMDDIPCTHTISIKTESLDSTETNTANVINGSHFGHQIFNHVKPAKTAASRRTSASVNTDASKQSQESGIKTAVGVCSLPENKTLLQELSKIQQSFSSPCSQSVPTDSQWTIIGITSLSSLLPTNTVTTSQAPMPVVGLITNKGDSSDSAQRKPAALDATILKIPLCSSTVSVANKDRTTDVSKRRSTLGPRGSSSVPLGNNDGNKFSTVPHMPSLTKPEDIKWTVVGIVGSPMPSSSALNPCISSPSEYLTTASQVTSARLEDVLSSQLVNVLSPLSTLDTSTILLSTSTSPNQLSPGGEGTKTKKPQESENKSAKTETPTSNEDHSNAPNQWKVVGVTQLGIPLTAASPVLPLAQRNPISPVMSMPFLIPTAPGSPFSSYATETTNIFTHSTGTSQSPSLLPPSLTSPSLLSSTALQFPVLNIGGTSCSSTLTVPSTTSLLNTSPSISMPTLQDLAQQQNFSQLIQTQLPACQSMLTLNETNQWNVVGVVANNQVSLLNPNQSNPPVVSSMTPVPTSSSENSPSHSTQAVSTQNAIAQQLSSCGDEKKEIKATAVKNVTIRQSLVSRHEESNEKRSHLKCKDMVKKHQQESTKIKKNTVSNLLRIKRMQQKTSENGSSEDGDQTIEDYQDISSYEVPRKKIKTRSLRSYAGNRKIFTRAQNKTSDEKTGLRSGTQISVLSCKSENDDDDDGTAHILVNSKEEKVVDAQIPLKEMCDDKITPAVVDAHSSSRRRKLKVPRKLVADLDYHPFDSSSDSN